MWTRLALAFTLLLTLVACAPKGGYKDVGPEEVYAALGQGALVVDVRTPEEYRSGHIPGAVNLPLDQIQAWAKDLPKDRPVYLYCRSGNRSQKAAEYLVKEGYTNLYNLEGGILAIQQKGLPLVR